MDVYLNQSATLSYVKVNYYKTGLTTLYDTKSQKLFNTDLASHCQADIPMSRVVDGTGTTVYAKSGSARIYVSVAEGATDSLLQATFSFGYAHVTVSPEVSVSFEFGKDGNVGIGVTPGLLKKVNIAGYKGISMNANGSVTTFD